MGFDFLQARLARWWLTFWTTSSVKIWSVWRRSALIVVFVTTGVSVLEVNTPRPLVVAVAPSVYLKRSKPAKNNKTLHCFVSKSKKSLCFLLIGARHVTCHSFHFLIGNNGILKRDCCRILAPVTNCLRAEHDFIQLIATKSSIFVHAIQNSISALMDQAMEKHQLAVDNNPNFIVSRPDSDVSAIDSNLMNNCDEGVEMLFDMCRTEDGKISVKLSISVK